MLYGRRDAVPSSRRIQISVSAKKETESDEDKEKLTPMAVKKPKIVQSISEISIAPEESKSTSIPFEMPEEISTAPEETKLETLLFEKPEEPSTAPEESKLTSIPFGMPEETQEVKEEMEIEEKLNYYKLGVKRVIIEYFF